MAATELISLMFSENLLATLRYFYFSLIFSLFASSSDKFTFCNFKSRNERFPINHFKYEKTNKSAKYEKPLAVEDSSIGDLVSD